MSEPTAEAPSTIAKPRTSKSASDSPAASTVGETPSPADSAGPSGAVLARGVTIGWLLPLVSVLWLGGKLWASHEQIKDAGGGTVALATAAAALPGVFQSALVGAAGVALATTAWRLRPMFRLLVSIGAGAVVTAVTGALILTSYSNLPSIDAVVVCLIVGGAIVGGLVAIPQVTLALAGGIAGTLSVLVGMTLLNSNVVLSRMLDWFGGDNSAESFVHASKIVQYTDFALVGILAGIVAFVFLRRRGLKNIAQYLLAGATAGIVLLLAYGMTNLGGSDLLDAAKSISDADRLVNDWESAESVPNAMIVFFVGAFVALISYGRTLNAKPTPASPPTAK